MAWPLRWATLGLVALVASMPKRQPLAVWNQSLSAPVGLYWVDRTPPGLGDVAVVRLAARIAGLAAVRGYLPLSAYLLKPVAAVGGDRVCRYGANILVRGALVARALEADHHRRALPSWRGCRKLGPGELFLLAHAPASFDGRYFGPIPAHGVVGRAALILGRH